MNVLKMSKESFINPLSMSHLLFFSNAGHIVIKKTRKKKVTVEKKKKIVKFMSMEDFIVEHWQLITSLVASLLNFIFALLIHKRSSHKISKLSSSEAVVDDALFEVSDKLHALISSISEEIYGKESAQKKISADVPEVPEETRR